MKSYTLRKSYPLKPIGEAKHAADKDCPDGSWKALTKTEKMNLSKLAKSAHDHLGLGLKGKALDAWRAEESIKACGVRISEAVHGNWAAIKAHFEDLGGRPEAAFETHMRGVDNKRRVAMWKLHKELEAKGLAPGYAETICRSKFKVPLDQASAKQIWVVFFDIKNRKAR